MKEMDMLAEKGIKSEQDILNAVIISKNLAQILQDSMEYVDSSEIDIFQKVLLCSE